MLIQRLIQLNSTASLAFQLCSNFERTITFNCPRSYLAITIKIHICRIELNKKGLVSSGRDANCSGSQASRGCCCFIHIWPKCRCKHSHSFHCAAILLGKVVNASNGVHFGCSYCCAGWGLFCGHPSRHIYNPWYRTHSPALI
jgi:hypothetical protein